MFYIYFIIFIIFNFNINSSDNKNDNQSEKVPIKWGLVTFNYFTYNYVPQAGASISISGSSSAADSKSDSASSAKALVKNKINLPQDILDGAANGLGCINNNKMRILAVGGLAAYLCINYRLLYLKYRLNNRNFNLWSNWKKNKKIEDLYKFDFDKLVDKLLADMYKKYISSENVDSDKACICEFLKDVSYEKNLIENYLNLINMIKKLKLTRLFLYNAKFEEKIRDRKLRLAFIESVFLDWIASCKIIKSKAVGL